MTSNPITIAVINGPNLNNLGNRIRAIYGGGTEEDLLKLLRSYFPQIRFNYFQSNFEGEIIGFIQEAAKSDDNIGIIINPGAYAHYSYAIADAIAESPLRVVEVHISNIHAREEFRSRSVTGAQADTIISGAGFFSYVMAAKYLKFLNSGMDKYGFEELPF